MSIGLYLLQVHSITRRDSSKQTQFWMCVLSHVPFEFAKQLVGGSLGSYRLARRKEKEKKKETEKKKQKTETKEKE